MATQRLNTGLRLDGIADELEEEEEEAESIQQSVARDNNTMGQRVLFALKE